MVKYLTSSAILDGLTVTDAFNPIASPLSLEKKRSKNLLSFNSFFVIIREELMDSLENPF